MYLYLFICLGDMEKSIVLPYMFTPRDYQLPLWRYVMGGGKRACVFHHRRAGKDKVMWNLLVTKACTTEQAGVYYYFFPTYKQGKKILWEGIDMGGMRYLDHLPKEMVKKKNDTEMKIELVNGSLIQVVGTDNYDSIRGTNPCFCVFSEFAFQDYRAWEVVRPILDANDGVAIFNTTPNGKNHAYKMYQAVKNDSYWFTEILTILDTKVIPMEKIEQARKEGVPEDMIQREYFCSFEASLEGAYYGKLMQQAQEQGRITRVPFNPTLPVYTFWDLGYNDTTAVWFMQRRGTAFYFIDYYEASREGLPHYAYMLREKQSECGYAYEKHYFPHDVEQHMIDTGMSRREILVSLGIPNYQIKTVPRPKFKEEAIEATRAKLPLCWFDEERCERGIEALRAYQSKKDEKNDTYFSNPLHDWASNGSDAFSYFALGFKDATRGMSSLIGDQFVDSY